jgi:hypothetical protein
LCPLASGDVLSTERIGERIGVPLEGGGCGIGFRFGFGDDVGPDVASRARHLLTVWQIKTKRERPMPTWDESAKVKTEGTKDETNAQ